MLIGRNESDRLGLGMPIKWDGSRYCLADSGNMPLLISHINFANPLLQSVLESNAFIISPVHPDNPGAEPLANLRMSLQKERSSSGCYINCGMIRGRWG